jgi:hypothetical protein
MPLHIKGVDKIAGVLKQVPIMRCALLQYSLSPLTLTSLHGSEQMLEMAAAYERMPHTKAGGQDNGRCHKRPDKPEAMIGMIGVPG